MYRFLYDEKHRFYEVVKTAKLKQTYKQKGLREKLFCEECEKLLSNYERYASLVLLNPLPKIIEDTERLIVCDVDYTKFKIFQMSLLWRVGITSMPHFSDVNLGVHHANRIRQMILNGDPGLPHEYGCWLFHLDHHKYMLSQWFIPPMKTRIEGHVCYQLVIFGFMWVYFVSSHNINSKFKNVFLSKKNELLIIKNNNELTSQIIENARKNLFG